MGARKAPVSGSVSRSGRRQRSESKTPIEQYEHPGKTRKNNPQVGLVDPANDKDAPAKKYIFDPHLDPKLDWTGKAENLSIKVPTVSLHVHERIDSRTVIETVRKTNTVDYEQLSLFNKFGERPPLRDEIQFYQHNKNWTNRLAAGDSLLVMNSLLQKEQLSEKVQMIYFDPPYGIKYGSNFQPFVNKREVTDRDVDLSQEPETIRAFRDTWELGIHSYLTFIRDRMLLARELLHESGSVFVQISDENYHRVRIVLDEVFGANNFVVSIPVKKKGSQMSGLMDPVNDYLLWYGKSSRDSGKIKFNPLYIKRELDLDTISEFKLVELPDGTECSLAKVPMGGKEIDYRNNPSQLFKDFPGARLFRSNPITSGGERKNQSLPFIYKGKTFNPGAGKCWKTTAREVDGKPAGMEVLATAGRLVVGENQLGFKRYLDDFGYQTLTNWWDGLGGASNPIYVVQTNPEIVQRCILMTTMPGDLVLDPTCGSGTTAVVAEKWGRRWITCDTSRVAITLAKQRLVTQVFDYFELKDRGGGVDSGFKYKTISHVTLGGIANSSAIKKGVAKAKIEEIIKREAPQVELIHEPIINNQKVRVTGPFTVEAVPAPVVKPLNQQLRMIGSADQTTGRSDDSARLHSWKDELLQSGIRAKNKKILGLIYLDLLPSTRWLHLSGETKTDSQRIVVSFGPQYAPLEQKQVALAIEEAQKLVPKPKIVAFAAFQFDPEAAKDIDETNWPGVQLLKIQMSPDLFTSDLKKKKTSNDLFWLVGQPDVEVREVKNGEFKGMLKVEVNGFDYYDPLTGKLDSGGKNNIAMWMLDTDYDGRSIFPRQIFFPLGNDASGWSKLAKTLRTEIDEELINQYKGTVSIPFNPGEYNRVAVKIVDDRGIESLRIIELSKGQG